MFLESQIKKIQGKYVEMIAKLGSRKDHFAEILKELTGDEALCYQFLVGAMPLSDAASYNGELLLSFVKNSITMRRTVPWGEQIPTELFLNDVLFYRINNENIEDYRALFCRELLPRVAGLSMYHAALEVNYWCYEKGTYQSSDERTISPLTMMKNGRGRCGEESVFTVSALRSVGIPARQCYAPRWSHCDDNHAWVEVWVDGEWYYMGACEPEPVLNKGWFTYASSKAMMVHSRVFSDFVTGESVIAKNGCTTELNHLSRYGNTAELSVTVLDEAKKPISGAIVQFQVLNYSELSGIATLLTGKDGTASLITGLGDLVVHVSVGGKHMTRAVSIEFDSMESNSMDFIPADRKKNLKFVFSEPYESDLSEFDFRPPAGRIEKEAQLTEAAVTAHQKKLVCAQAVRQAKEAAFFTEAAAKEYASHFLDCQQEIAEFLVLAKANRGEIIRFLNSGYELKDKVELLKQLTVKDFIDCKAEQMEDALSGALPYKFRWEESIYREYVLSPRIQNEYLTSYRSTISEYFSSEQRSLFQQNPIEVSKYIERNIQICDDLDYAPLSADPVGLLQLKAGSGLSKKILFVAVCRSMGIPARIYSVTGATEFYQNGRWRNSDGTVTVTGKLTIQNTGYPLQYYQNFSIAKRIHGEYRTLSFPDLRLEQQAELQLEPGSYRIIVTNRQIDGTVLARSFYADVNESNPVTVILSGREGDIRSRLHDFFMQNAELLDLNGRMTDLAAVTGTHSKNIIALLDVQKEPTEHLLNEFLELQGLYRKEDLSVMLLVPDKKSFEYPLLMKVLQEIPSSGAYQYSDLHLCDKLFEEVQAGDHRLPLVIVADGSLKAKFHFSNYNVGTAALLLQITAKL